MTTIYTTEPYRVLATPYRRTFSGPIDQFTYGEMLMSMMNEMLQTRVAYPGFNFTERRTCAMWIANGSLTGWFKVHRAISSRSTAAKVGSTSRQIIGTLAVPSELIVGDGYQFDQQNLMVRTTIFGTCTSSASGTSTFVVTLGSANNVTTDQVLLTIALTSATSGTTIPFCLEVLTTFRYHYDVSQYKTITSARLMNNGTTGISTSSVGVYQGSEVNTTTTANGYVSTQPSYLNITHQSSSASVTPTFQQVVMEVIE